MKSNIPLYSVIYALESSGMFYLSGIKYFTCNFHDWRINAKKNDFFFFKKENMLYWVKSS